MLVRVAAKPNLTTSTIIVVCRSPRYIHWSLKTHIIGTRPLSGAIDNLLPLCPLGTFLKKVPQYLSKRRSASTLKQSDSTMRMRSKIHHQTKSPRSVFSSNAGSVLLKAIAARDRRTHKADRTVSPKGRDLVAFANIHPN